MLFLGPLYAEEELDLEMEVFFAPEELPPDVVESASKHRQSIFWSPSAITVITREDIRGSGATTLVDLLRRVPGFEIYELKPSYPVAGARGLTDESNNLILVLVDGREVLQEFLGSVLWSTLHFDLQDVERIEVIRGPGSALYGANAFSAVVNITTTHDNPGGGGVKFTGGEQGRFKVHGTVHDRLNLGKGVLSYSLSLGDESMFSPSDYTDNLLQVFRANGWLRYRQGQSVDLALYAGTQYGRGMYYTHVLDMYLWDSLLTWTMAKAAFGLGDSAKLKAQLYFSNVKTKLHSRIAFGAMDIFIFEVPDFSVEYPVVDGQVQLDIQATEDLLFIAGGNLRYIRLESDLYVPGILSEIRGAGFLQFNWTLLDEFQLTGGVRLDLTNEMENAISPRVALAYRPVPDHAFRLSYGLAFRKPSLYEGRTHPKIESYNPAIPEIVEKMKTQMGNENLVNEKVHSIEAGWKAQFLDDRLHTSVDLFFNIYKDIISFVVDLQLRMGLPDIVNSTLRYENEPADILAFGSEAEFTFVPAPNWKLWCNFSIRNLMSQADLPSPDKNEMVWHASLGGRYLPDSGLLVDLAFHYVSSYHLTIPDPENSFDPPVYYRMGNELMLIGRLGYRVNLSETQLIEGGLTARTPLGASYREYPGTRLDRTERSKTASDFGGDMIVRLIQVYLRWSF